MREGKSANFGQASSIQKVVAKSSDVQNSEPECQPFAETGSVPRICLPEFDDCIRHEFLLLLN